MQEVIVKKPKSKFNLKNMGDATTATIASAGIGALGGFVFAYYNEKKYWICMLVGLLAGGVIGTVAVKKLTK